MPLTVTRRAPLVLARGAGALDVGDLSALTDAVDAQAQMGVRFLVVGDALAVESVSAAARQFIGEHRNQKRDAVAALDLGLVLAIRSPLVRGAMTAISWFSGAFADLRTVEHRRELATVARAILVEKKNVLAAGDDEALDALATS